MLINGTNIIKCIITFFCADGKQFILIIQIMSAYPIPMHK